jgi:hypothetical protein
MLYESLVPTFWQTLPPQVCHRTFELPIRRNVAYWLPRSHVDAQGFRAGHGRGGHGARADQDDYTLEMKVCLSMFEIKKQISFFDPIVFR